MNPVQHLVFKSAVAPGALLDNTSATPIEIDCRDYDYLTIVCHLGATDIAMTALEVQAAATSGGALTTITGADFDGGTDIDGGTLALPSATDDGQLSVFHVDMRNQNKFVKLLATFGDGTVGGYFSAIAILSRQRVDAYLSTDIATGGVCRV